MARKKKKIRQVRYIEHGMSDMPKDVKSKKKGKSKSKSSRSPKSKDTQQAALPRQVKW